MFVLTAALILANICIVRSVFEYIPMSCTKSGYLNGWDSRLYSVDKQKPMNGMFGYHSNSKEDRRFGFRRCYPRATGNIGMLQTLILPDTVYDREWERGCGGNTALVGVDSYHSNKAEDRRFRFRCVAKFSNNYILKGCKWTHNYVNEFDRNLDYSCPAGGLIRTIGSQHSNNKEDRRFKFECCRLVKNYLTFAPYRTINFPPYFANDYDRKMDFNVYNDNSFIGGIYSEHVSKYEDRRFKFSEVQMVGFTATTGYETVQTEPTAWDKEWTISCKNVNNGNAAMVGLQSEHNNGKEDRQYKNVKCGRLNDLYSLTLCGFTGYLNSYDYTMNFKCANGGVIRSIWSKHSNSKEDRVYKVECCQVIKGGDFKFTQKRGFWKLVHNCDGCPSTQYRLAIGVSGTESKTVTKQFSTSFTLSVTMGYKYGEAKVSGEHSYSVTASSTLAYSTSTAISSSVTKSKTMTDVINCDKRALYQWHQYGFDEITGKPAEVESKQYVCSDNKPKCVAGDCKVGTQCQICKSNGRAGYSAKTPPVLNLEDIQEELSDIEDRLNNNENNNNNNIFLKGFGLNDLIIIGLLFILIIFVLYGLICAKKGSFKYGKVGMMSSAESSVSAV